jgi:hypothetical protein
VQSHSASTGVTAQRNARSSRRFLEILFAVAPAAPTVAHVNGWEKVTAIATAVGGAGAMLAAFFAWLAARRSAETSRDAKDALAASLKPQVHLMVTQYAGGEPVVARAVVVGPLSTVGLAGVFPAANVRIEFNLTSGGRGDNSIALLEPNGSRWARDPPYLNVVIGHPSEDWPPAGGDHVTATVSFSDVRRAATYQQSMSGDLCRSDDPASVSFQNVSEPTETRLTP